MNDGDGPKRCVAPLDGDGTAGEAAMELVDAPLNGDGPEVLTSRVEWMIYAPKPGMDPTRTH